MINRKKVYHLLFAFALMLGLLTAMSITAFATDLRIGNKSYSGPASGSGWKFEPAQDGSATLTLNNFVINGGRENPTAEIVPYHYEESFRGEGKRKKD